MRVLLWDSTVLSPGNASPRRDIRCGDADLWTVLPGLPQAAPYWSAADAVGRLTPLQDTGGRRPSLGQLRFHSIGHSPVSAARRRDRDWRSGAHLGCRSGARRAITDRRWGAGDSRAQRRSGHRSQLSLGRAASASHLVDDHGAVVGGDRPRSHPSCPALFWGVSSTTTSRCQFERCAPLPTPRPRPAGERHVWNFFPTVGQPSAGVGPAGRVSAVPGKHPTRWLGLDKNHATNYR
jgi:hypothetical protein